MGAATINTDTKAPHLAHSVILWNQEQWGTKQPGPAALSFGNTSHQAAKPGSGCCGEAAAHLRDSVQTLQGQQHRI